MSEKDYMFTVTVIWNVALTASSKEEARNILIDGFARKYKIALTDNEIKEVVDNSKPMIKEEK